MIKPIESLNMKYSLQLIGGSFILKICFVLFFSISYCQNSWATYSALDSLSFFKANHPYIQYTGRIDFSNPLLPRMWAPGCYIKATFSGPDCQIVLNDEELWGKNHNYLEVVIDDNKPIRIQTTGKNNVIKVASGLSNGPHTLVVCKNTESNIGYLEMVGLKCKSLLPVKVKPIRRIEFIGNSITCGAGSDASLVECGKGVWQDQHNAYMAYGPVTARSLNAQWHLTSVSGIGLIHSCCNMTITMPLVFDKVNLMNNTIQWDFSKYIPDVVTICLGQNDGVQDSIVFCKAYVDFIGTLRLHYPMATIICLTSPMADINLVKVMKVQLSAIVKAFNDKADNNVYKYFFSKRYYHGCDTHPDLSEHQEIAAELTAYIQKIKKW
jgi:hypothetical protein